MNLSVKQKQTQGHKRTDLCLPKGREWREGWIGSLRLVDANYYMDNGRTRFYYTAQRTVFSILL